MTRHRKKICFISVCAYGLFHPESNVPFGGAEVQMYQIAKHLAKDKDADVHFIVYHSGGKAVERIEGVSVHTVRSWATRLKILRGLSLRLSFLLRLWRIGADVYVQRAAGIETGLIAFYCRIFRKKFVYMSASLMDVDGSYVAQYGARGLFYEYGLKRAHTVIAQSVDQRGSLKERYGIDAVILKNSFFLAEKGDGDSKSFILWVGSAQKLKQPEKFLELADSFPSEKFVMIMPKNDVGLWERVRREVSARKNVDFIEQVPFSEIDRYYRRAKIFVNTSTFEGFPNTFIQAAMYGVPILSLNVNPDNFLNEYDCGSCAQGDEKRLANQMRDLLENQELWNRQSRNARKYVEENHDIEENIKKFREVLKVGLDG